MCVDDGVLTLRRQASNRSRVAKRGEAHRVLVFDKASGVIKKATMQLPKSWKEFDLGTERRCVPQV